MNFYFVLPCIYLRCEGCLSSSSNREKNYCSIKNEKVDIVETQSKPDETMLYWRCKGTPINQINGAKYVHLNLI